MWLELFDGQPTLESMLHSKTTNVAPFTIIAFRMLFLVQLQVQVQHLVSPLPKILILLTSHLNDLEVKKQGRIKQVSKQKSRKNNWWLLKFIINAINVTKGQIQIQIMKKKLFIIVKNKFYLTWNNLTMWCLSEEKTSDLKVLFFRMKDI